MSREALTPALIQLLQKQLGSVPETDAVEILDLVPLPRTSDRMVRFRNLQEVLDEFESSGDSVYSYVIHVRKKDPAAAAAAVSEEPSPTADKAAMARVEDIYLSDGTLNGDFLLQNAQLLFEAGEFTASRQIFNTLRKYSTHTSAAMLGLARCLEAEGETEEALRAYEESILYHPQLETYQRFAALLIRVRKDQQAAEILERALLIRDVADRSRFEMHKAAGNCWLRAQSFTKAERHYQKALEIVPESDVIATNLGALNLQMGRPTQAIQCFQQALSRNPADAQALTGIATAELSLGRKAEAHDSFVRSLQVNLNQPKAIFQLVKLAYELKQYKNAADVLSRYIEVAPFNANLLYSLAGLEFHLGRMDRSMKVVEQILQIQPDHEEAAKLKERITLRRHG